MEALDILALGVVGLAAIRGIFIGLTRQVSSIASLAAGVLGVRFLGEPASALLLELSPLQMPHTVARWIAGALLFIACALVIGFLGRILQRGVQAAGLRAADRLGGATLGAAEGALVVGIGIAILLATLGKESALLTDSRSVALYEQAQTYVTPQIARAIDVASPPPKR